MLHTEHILKKYNLAIMFYFFSSWSSSLKNLELAICNSQISGKKNDCLVGLFYMNYAMRYQVSKFNKEFILIQGTSSTYTH